MNEEVIKQKALNSVVWKFLERIGAQLVTLVVSIIIARILDPKDYSVVSLVTIFFSFANVLISGGFSTALIQKKSADKEDYSTVLIFSLLISFVIYIILFICAPVIANFYSQNILTSIIRIMGLSLPVTAIKSIWCAYISSNLMFKKFFFATIGGTVVSAIIGILMAIKGYGPWALVMQQMTNTIIDTIILILTTRIGMKIKFSFYKFRSLLSYGWKILLTSLIGTLYNQLIPLVIGKKYSSEDLSFYTKGKSFPELISASTTNTLSAVLFPTLSKFQDKKEKLLANTRLFMRISSFVCFPMMLGFLSMADIFIRVVLGEKWIESSFYVQIFCFVYMLDIVTIGNCETIKAMGRSDVYLLIEIIKKSLYFITIALFVFFTNTAHTLAYASAICAIIALTVNVIPNISLIGYKIFDQIMDILPNFISCVPMVIVVRVIGLLDWNFYLLFFMQILCGVLTYLFIALVTHNSSFIYLVNKIRKKQMIR